MNNLFKYPSKYLVCNAIKTPDGTVLESTHRHDFKQHVDTVTGTDYAIDGGLSYQRIVGNKYENLSVRTDDHFIAREHLTWGTYGKDGDQPLTYTKIKDLETGNLVYPLKKADFLLQVKKGELDYTTVVAPTLEMLIDEVELLAAKSNFPESADRLFWQDFIQDVYDVEMDKEH